MPFHRIFSPKSQWCTGGGNLSCSLGNLTDVGCLLTESCPPGYQAWMLGKPLEMSKVSHFSIFFSGWFRHFDQETETPASEECESGNPGGMDLKKVSDSRSIGKYGLQTT